MSAPAALTQDIDLRLFPIEAVHAAVYRFADFGCHIADADWDNMRVQVAFSSPPAKYDPEDLGILLRQELTDQVLRNKIRKETETIRTLILAHAFSGSAIAE